MKSRREVVLCLLVVCTMPCFPASDYLRAATNTSVQTQPNGQLTFDTNPADDLTVSSIQPRGPNDVMIVTRNAKPAFFRNCVAGAHYKTVTLTMRKAGGDARSAGTTFLRFTFKLVTVTGVSRNADGSMSVGLTYGSSDGPVRPYSQ